MRAQYNTRPHMGQYHLAISPDDFPFVIRGFNFEVQQSDRCGWLQPGGLAESSRWLKRSENHRNKSEESCTSKRCESLKQNLLQAFLIWHPVGVRYSSCLNRWSSLRYNHRLLSGNPPGSPVALQT